MNLDAHNRPFLRQRGRLRVYAGIDATIVVKFAGMNHQICQVGYSSDGSIRFQWPYLRVKEGIVAAASIPSGAKGSTTIQLHEQGKFTSQLVKLSHHTSGEALFSKTGKVRSEIRRQSFPLTGPIGRIFELHAFGPAGFRTLERMKAGRLYLGFDYGSSVPEAVLIRGEWRRKESIARFTYPRRGTVGPQTMWMNRRTKFAEQVVFFAPPLSYPHQTHTLCIAFSTIPLPTGVAEPGIIFMGGFDQHEVPPERSGEPFMLTDFPIAMYPAKSSSELRQRIGSIDINSPPAL